MFAATTAASQQSTCKVRWCGVVLCKVVTGHPDPKDRRQEAAKNLSFVVFSVPLLAEK